MKKAIIIPIFLAAQLFFSPNAFTQNTTLDSMITLVADLSAKGELKKALEISNKANSEFPDNAKALTARGLLKAGSLKDFKSAYMDFEKAIKITPDDGELYILKGRCSKETGNYKQSYLDFGKAFELRPKNGYKNYSTGNLIDDINIACSLASPKAFKAAEEGKAFIVDKNYEKAIERFSKAIKIDSNYSSAYSLRGMIYQILKQNEKAVSDYKKALSLNPYSDMSLFGLGQIQKLKEDYSAMLVTYSKLLTYKADNVPAMVSYGLALYKTGEKDKACGIWSEALKAGSEDAREYMKKVCQ